MLVNLVRDDGHVVLDAEAGDQRELVVSEDLPGGVVGSVEQEDCRTRQRRLQLARVKHPRPSFFSQRDVRRFQVKYLGL